ncbi:RIP metalloprotease RseP [Anaerosphaera multitolerans]|uniref:Zinc metalloprotease n=1 Tax=Anaerosphaera multitolerans TaxID=2487351 RepID=A0A437S593_9FIRM|nr:RIP metalloprotease RseP [Anaerosphaera multitolerans]RVU54179.1 RIP metalloprotease RseP [Anaerosphaera multitolerans]
MFTLIGSIIVFLIVILIHEFGHFFVAKLVGIKVDEFSIGMGPEIFHRKKGETQYSLRLLPIGGYVAMEGEEAYSDDPRSFNNVSVFKRMAVVVAGVFMNFLLAIIAFFVIALLVGSPTNKIDNVLENSPAQYSDLRAGDEIIVINGNKINSWSDISENISLSQGDDIEIEIIRGKENLKKTISLMEKDGNRVIGIEPAYEKSILLSMKYSLEHTISLIKDIFTTFKMLFQGKLNVGMFAGPIGVIQIIGQETSKGILYLINILGFISVNLGIINLLPIPALDGGKLVFLLIEKVRGKKVDEELEGKLSYISFSLLLALVLYVTLFGDLKRIFGW